MQSPHPRNIVFILCGVALGYVLFVGDDDGIVVSVERQVVPLAFELQVGGS